MEHTLSVYKRLLGNIGVRQSCPVVNPFLSSLHCLKVRLCVEQERSSMKARQAMLDSRLPSERERRRGGSRECTWNDFVIFEQKLIPPGDRRGLDRGGGLPARGRLVKCRGRRTGATTPGPGLAAPRSTRRSGG